MQAGTAGKSFPVGAAGFPQLCRKSQKKVIASRSPTNVMILCRSVCAGSRFFIKERVFLLNLCTFVGVQGKCAERPPFSGLSNEDMRVRTGGPGSLVLQTEFPVGSYFVPFINVNSV